MNISSFLEKLRTTPETIDFNELMTLIEEHYLFSPCVFKNGDLQNKKNENNGSCKLFYFATLQSLNEEQTLACFGAYYRDDVLKNLEGDNHQNIRSFIEHGWQGIKFEGEVLVDK